MDKAFYRILKYVSENDENMDELEIKITRGFVGFPAISSIYNGGTSRIRMTSSLVSKMARPAYLRDSRG